MPNYDTKKSILSFFYIRYRFLQFKLDVGLNSGTMRQQPESKSEVELLNEPPGTLI